VFSDLFSSRAQGHGSSRHERLEQRQSIEESAMHRTTKQRLIAAAALAMVSAPLGAALSATQASGAPATYHASLTAKGASHASIVAASHTAAQPAVGYADCTYVVTWTTAGVWEKPTKSTH
jgi:hypothetical protein